MLILQPAKLAMPDTAFLGSCVQVRTAPAGVVILRSTEALLVVTVLPMASWTVTTGWAPKAVPPVAFEGLVVKASWVAGAAAMVRLALMALVSPLVAEVSV